MFGLRAPCAEASAGLAPDVRTPGTRAGEETATLSRKLSVEDAFPVRLIRTVEGRLRGVTYRNNEGHRALKVTGDHRRLLLQFCYIQTGTARASPPRRSRFPHISAVFLWLGCRDSNPNYLIQSPVQTVYYRLTASKIPHIFALFLSPRLLPSQPVPPFCYSFATRCHTPIVPHRVRHRIADRPPDRRMQRGRQVR